MVSKDTSHLYNEILCFGKREVRRDRLPSSKHVTFTLYGLMSALGRTGPPLNFNAARPRGWFGVFALCLISSSPQSPTCLSPNA